MICNTLKISVGRVLKLGAISLILASGMITNVKAAGYPGQYGSGGLDIALTPNATGYGSMYIEWKSSGYAYQDKYFRVFRRSDTSDYENVSIDYRQVTSVRCLQIYPTGYAAGQMKSWVVNTGYGKGIIQVDNVQLSQFNGNPQAYLQDSQGNWKYDVIFFGTWDGNAGNDLSSSGRVWTQKFAEAGRGVIFGHDTINIGSDCYHPNFSALAQYTGTVAKPAPWWWMQSRVQVVKNGLFNTYPNYLGNVGYVLNIPEQHTSGQVLSTGYSWLRFLDGGGQKTPDGDMCSEYLITYRNGAMIQTGHSSGQATSDEQKILANVIFYCNQLLFSQYYTNDYAAQDYAKPNKPTISSGGNRTYNVFATDNGQTYTYYVESYDKNNVDLNDVLDRSPERTHTVTTGVVKYIYKFDNSPNTTVSSASQSGVMTQTDGRIPEVKGYDYIHVAAVDGAGNIGPTEHARTLIQIVYNQNNGNNEQVIDSIPNQQSVYTMKNNQFVYNGYRFLEWNTKQNGSGTSYRQGQTINIQDDLQVYAIWERVWTLQIDPNGGKWYDDSGLTVNKQYGDLSKIDTNPTYRWYNYRVQFRLQIFDKKRIRDAVRDGYSFLGWRISS